MPLSAFVHFQQTQTAVSIAHEGQFPAVTLSFNLAPGAALGDAVRAIKDAVAGMDAPVGLHADFQGAAAAFGDSLSTEPLLILAAIVTVYIVLGVLYESYIHPITILSTLPSAGVGAFLALMLCRSEFSIIALIGIVLLIGIVKKNAIMMIDFALEAEREQGKSPARGDPSGLPAALPADHDDHGGGAARRGSAGARDRDRRRAPPAAGHHHRRRSAGLAGADAVHHAGHLSLHGAAGVAVFGAPRSCSRRAPRNPNLAGTPAPETP